MESKVAASSLASSVETYNAEVHIGKKRLALKVTVELHKDGRRLVSDYTDSIRAVDCYIIDLNEKESAELRSVLGKHYGDLSC